MSHATGEVIQGDRVIGYFEYDGTADNAISDIYRSRDELWANWRKSTHPTCTCGGKPVPVVLWADYGSGYWWYSTACLKCNVITGPRSLDFDDIITCPGYPAGVKKD